MKVLDIHAFIRKKRKKYKTAKPKETAENKLARNFYTTAPNKKWVTDVTEFKLSLIHISEPTRQAEISYAVFCLKKKKQTKSKN